MIVGITFIIILSFLVLIHELGHFLAARFMKIRVEEFGFGYPPRAFTLFKKAGTIFSLNWIPFGGFVKMQGEDGPAEPTGNQEADPKPIAKTDKDNKIGPFYAKSARARLFVILAGVAVNFIFGILAFSTVYSFLGIPEYIDEARIAAISEGSPAEAANLPTEVDIVEIKYQDEVAAVGSNQDAVDAVTKWQGQTVTVVTSGECQGFECSDDRQEFSVYLRTQEEIPEGQGSMGVAFNTTAFVFYPWYEMPFRGVWVGLQQAIFLGLLIITTLGRILVTSFQSGQVPQEIAGPVGVVHQASQSGIFNEGFLMLLNFSGMLSVNLAIMNLLPIPALDGGRALFIALEKVVGKRKIQAIEGYANYGGFIILVALLALVTVRDVWRLIGG